VRSLQFTQASHVKWNTSRERARITVPLDGRASYVIFVLDLPNVFQLGQSILPTNFLVRKTVNQ